MFYITNTEAEITLTGVNLTNSADGALLRVEGNSSERGWARPDKTARRPPSTPFRRC